MICVFEDGHFSNVCLEIDAGILQHWGLFWNRRCADGGLFGLFSLLPGARYVLYERGIPQRIGCDKVISKWSESYDWIYSQLQ